MKLTVTILSVLALSSALVTAQEPGRRDGDRPRPPEQRDGERPRPFMRGPDPMMQNLFPPPLIMEAGEKLGLTEQQRDALRNEMEKSRDKFEPAQQKLREEMEKLGQLLKEPRVDEEKAIAQLDKVLVAEAEIKMAQLGLNIRIKNLLTPEQQEKLREFMKERRPPMSPEGERGPRPSFRGERDGERRRPPQPPPNQ